MGVRVLFAVALCQFFMICTASATEYSDEEFADFLDVVDSCNATHGPGLATTLCVLRRDGDMVMGLLKAIPDNISENRGLSTEVFGDRLDAEDRGPCLGLCALVLTLDPGFIEAFKLMKKKICAKFPGQLPFGILRADNEVSAVSEFENLVALERKEPFCLGLCKATYISLWLITKPVCKWKFPFGR